MESLVTRSEVDAQESLWHFLEGFGHHHYCHHLNHILNMRSWPSLVRWFEIFIIGEMKTRGVRVLVLGIDLILNEIMGLGSLQTMFRSSTCHVDMIS